MISSYLQTNQPITAVGISLLELGGFRGPQVSHPSAGGWEAKVQISSRVQCVPWALSLACREWLCPPRVLLLWTESTSVPFTSSGKYTTPAQLSS